MGFISEYSSFWKVEKLEVLICLENTFYFNWGSKVPVGGIKALCP